MVRRRCSRTLSARVEPDDILQSAFGSFFRRAAGGATGDDLWGLLLLICLHKIRDAAAYHQAAKRDARRVSDADLTDIRLPDPAAADETVLRELTSLVEELLGRLPHPDDQMIRMRIRGHEVAEIATRTGRSRRTVERVLSDFRRTLKSLTREG